MNAAVTAEDTAVVVAAAAAGAVANEGELSASGECALRGEGDEMVSPRSGEEELSSGLFATSADFPASTMDRGMGKERDVLQLLLTQASPSCVGSGRIDDSGVEHADPALNVAFPVMHTYNLQLTDTIPMQRGEAEVGREESRDLLRPSVRLLCSIGRWSVARCAASVRCACE